MQLPAIITELVNAQNSFNSGAYANCFSVDAIVFDEGNNHKGREEIKEWIAAANLKYQSLMEPIDYNESADKAALTAKVSGAFKGSPINLKYNLEFSDGLISSLKITG